MSFNAIVSRVGITPVGSADYRLNRLRFHLLAYSIARKAQLQGKEAKFVIRCDDTNEANVNRSFLEPYLDTLASLGVKADLNPYDVDQTGESLFQSKRKNIYANYCEQLLDRKLAYRDETGAVFFDTIKFFKEFEESLEEGKLSVTDLSMGKIKVDPKIPINDGKGKNDLVPFPIMRANGDYLFNLCSPIDDALMNVTHVVRDRTKLSLLPQQEMVRTALEFPEVNYLHAPLLVNSEGKRLLSDSQFGEATFQNFISKGLMSKALVSYLLSGFAGPSENYYSSIDEFSQQVDFARVHQSNTTFSHAVLEQHNKKALTKSSNDEYKGALKEFIERQEGLEEMNVDEALLDIMAKARRKLPEAIKTIVSIQAPVLEFANTELSKSIVLILGLLANWEASKESSIEAFLIDKCDDHLKTINLSKKEYYTALRYILTGEEQGLDLRLIIRYLNEAGLITNRVKHARKWLK